MSTLHNTFYQQSIISIADFSRIQLEYLIKLAISLKLQPQPHLLREKLIATCFFEPSTRTRLSFETAVQKLSGRIIGFSDASHTSAKKGETLADTARIISSYADAIIIRHHKDGAARILSQFSEVPVINAGDGTNQHPSQTLLDLLTIYETQGTLENLNIVLVGDLKYGRTVHSLAMALAQFNCRFFFVSPPSLAMPEYICQVLQNMGTTFETLPTLEEGIQVANILYMTRVQKERFDEQEFSKISGQFRLQANMLNNAPAGMKVLHPLPRVDEIAPDVDSTNFAYYFEQAKNGIYARQAILASVLNEQIHF